MSSTDKSFKDVLELFEANGWKLQKSKGRIRIFTKPNECPWYIPVENGKVKFEHVEKFKQFLKEEQSWRRIASQTFRQIDL